MSNDNLEESGDDDVMTVAVPPSLDRVRLDKALATLVPDFSRTRLKGLIEDGLVMVDGQTVDDPAAKVAAGATLVFVVPTLEETTLIPENIPLDIVYEDSDLLVINKAASMVVHPAVGHRTGTLVHALLHYCGDQLSGVGGVKRPGIVHRLDRGTSGLMMVAKNDAAHQALSAQLADRSLGRVYTAITCGVPMPVAGTVDQPIGRHKTQRLKMAVNGAGARVAITHYKMVERFGDVGARVECRLATGRTHQIRVHMAKIGAPLWGDPLYGPVTTSARAALRRAGLDDAAADAVMGFPRQALHAQEIHFIHPRTGAAMSFTAPLPDDVRGLLAVLKDHCPGP